MIRFLPGKQTRQSEHVFFKDTQILANKKVLETDASILIYKVCEFNFSIDKES